MTDKLSDNQEVYEFTEDTVENFDQMNDKFRNNYDWIIETDKDFVKVVDEVKVEEKIPSPMEVYKILSAPSKQNESQVKLTEKYISQQSDPFERLTALKHELADCKKDIDEYAELFKHNDFVNSKNNFSELHEEINLYKAKVDAFIDYNIFNSLKANTSISSEKAENTNDDVSKASIEENRKYASNYDKNNIIINSLISQIQSLQEGYYDDVLKGDNDKSKESRNVVYEIISNPENQVNIISSKIGELESQINQLQKIIGEWSLVRIYFNILISLLCLSMTIMKASA